MKNTMLKTPLSFLFKVCSIAISFVSFSSSVIAAQCQYVIVDEWAQGFKAEVTIVNNDAPITDWTLQWEWSDGSSFNNGWNATYDCTGSTCSVTPPSWLNQIASGGNFTFGFIGDKTAANAEQIVLTGDICDGSDNGSVDETSSTWVLESETSSLQYVSIKKEHTAENNRFEGLSGSIDGSGNVLLAIDLNQVQTEIDIRNTRLQSLLFETTYLPTAWLSAQVDIAAVNAMETGDTDFQTLTGELALHAIRAPVTADVIVAKLAEDAFSVSSVSSVNVSAEDFDMAAGIEALRVVAGLTSIGESVPVYFALQFALEQHDDNLVIAPEVPEQPSDLLGSFDAVNAQASLTWQDNALNETLYLVRRKASDGDWQTSAELGENADALIEGLPQEGEFDYKVIAVNDGMPSLASNEATVTVTEANQVVRGQQIYLTNCAGCHGVNGEGIGSNPPINTERNVADMIEYIRDFMPQGDPTTCDQQCAEDVAEYIQTLWVTEISCDTTLTPVSYGARQLKILTRFEYQNSVEDLLGVDYPVSDGLSADTKVGFFRNNTFAAIVPTSYSNYLLVAEDIAQWSADRDFSPALNCDSYNQDCADTFISEVAPKIFRRPLTEDEISVFETMANGSYTSGDVKAGIQMALEGLLSAPQFLYRHELGEANPDNNELDSDAFELTSYEMATFLAYTYTGSTPDDVLLTAAENDELRDFDNIVSHAERLVSNAEGVMSEFVGSWLGTEELEQAAKDPTVWNNFDELVPHLQSEINTTFSHIMLDPNEGFASLYSGSFTYLNETLASHYGIDGVSGDSLQKVDTTDRGGILANGAFMARWGEDVETSPILRSVRVRRRMLCQDQPDPPAGTFAAREEKLAELSELLQDPTTTNRLKYHRLTEDTPCTNCHLQYINPLGFGMEDFDTVGRVRTQDLNGNAIDASGELFAPNNYSDLDSVVPFTGTTGLGSVLATLDSAQACLPKQLFRYVMGVGHQEIDPDNPESTQLSDQEKSSYACEVDDLTDAMLNDSPRAMLEKFGALEAVRYRKAWSREQ